MSTLQHINSVIDYNWPEYQRRFPAFNKPQIVPAETLRGMAPTYLHSAIDQDPTSMYMFIACDPTKGDCSRKTACEFFDDLFTNKLRMPSSYEANEGYSHEEAIDKEVLPAENDRAFRSYYDEQMARMDAQRREEERQRRIDNLGFDPDDPDIIDAEVIEPDGSTSGGSQQRSTAVGQAQSTAVGQARKIFYCIDFHVNAGAMLGYNGNNNRLGGRRRPGGYLREAYTTGYISNMVSFINIYDWARTNRLTDNLESIAKACATTNAPQNLKAFIFRYTNTNKIKLIALDDKTNKAWVDWEGIKEEFPWQRIYNIRELTVMTKDQLDRMISNHRNYQYYKDWLSRRGFAKTGFFYESDKESDPEKMMKEFTETSDMDEDDMLKNRPHNLHKDEKLLENNDLDEDDDVLEDDDLEECDDLTEDTAETEELEEDDEVTEKDEFELNESLINFSTRLIRG